ncbi:MAG: hypothetical protein LBN74_05775 [Prevotella sp.]|jgi:hypothetical protein|nr:hypothetical protein [Prevotella sp.]
MAEKDFYKSILRRAGGENMGGFKNRILFYPEHLFKVYPTLVENPQDTEDLATGEGAFEPVDEDTEPMAIYATDKTVGMKAENQGELDGQSFKISGEFFHPGTATEVAGVARKLNNTPGFLVLESPEGEQFMVGQKGLPAYVKPSFDGGTQRTDRRGFAFTFEADSYTPLIKLKVKIDMDQYFNPVTEP